MVEIKNEPLVLKLLNNEVELDSICYYCVDTDYSGYEIKYTVVKNNCTACNGARYRTTSNGKAILDFVKRHLKIND